MEAAPGNASAVGPGIEIADVDQLRDITIQVEIVRGDKILYKDETRSSQMKRSLEELVDYLTKEMDFHQGAFLMTGTGIVPGDDFSLQPGDVVRINIASLSLENEVSP